MLFDDGDEGIAVYAHEEPSSVHPLVAMTHVAGKQQDVAAGVSTARAQLPVKPVRATVDPVHAPWKSQPEMDS